ncbi:MAG: aspartate aminotransferase family protein [Chromatiales bacterium]|jgi:sphinganine-1-phosphate aldolase|nr:aspartate aminotransferase family protein [Chromatiales bacterium]
MSATLPPNGTSRDVLLAEMESARVNDVKWREGRLGLYVHFGGDDVLQVAKDAYLSFFSENALGPTAFPSLKKFETEVVAWTASILNGKETAAGNISSGGTESIFLAMKSIRGWARSQGRGGSQPVLVAPYSAHPAFDKAADLLGMRVKRVALADDFCANVAAMRDAVDGDTVAIMGSAPGFPHGVIDAIEDIAAIALEKDLWMHVDACVGGFVLPFARAAGYPIPPFDFAVEGVRSMSADLHKYGFAAKGASAIVYRDAESHAFQPFEFDAWPRGRYAVPTFAGSRPGGAVAAAWAVMRYLGRAGYVRIITEVLGARDTLVDAINAHPDLCVWGDPGGPIVAYGSPTLDIIAIGEALSERGWFVTRGAEPPCIHIGMLTLMHVPVIEQYIDDLNASVAEVAAGRFRTGTAAATYGG